MKKTTLIMIVAGLLVLITSLITYFQVARQSQKTELNTVSSSPVPSTDRSTDPNDGMVTDPATEKTDTLPEQPPRFTLFSAPQMTIRVPREWSAQRKETDQTNRILIQTPHTYTPQPASILIEYGRSYEPQEAPPIYTTKTIIIDNKRVVYSAGRRVLPPLDRRGTQGRTLQERLMTGKSNGQSFAISATYFSEEPIDALDKQLFEIMSSIRFDRSQ